MSNQKNRFHFGDNLRAMRDIDGNSIDMVYADPPFNSNANYNVFMPRRGVGGNGKNIAQKTVFEDTWTWDEKTEREWHGIKDDGSINPKAIDLLHAHIKAYDKVDAMAYMVMMLPRIHQMHRILRPGGAMFLHCDDNADFIIRQYLDIVFGPGGFRNHLVWKRTNAKADARGKMPRITDTIFLYAKAGGDQTWNKQHMPYTKEYIEKFYRHIDEDGRRYQLTDLTANVGKIRPWRGITPGRPWAYCEEKLEEMDANGQIYWPANGGVPRFIRYLDEQPGKVVQSLIDHIGPIATHAKERTGYPTQKPLVLMELLIKTTTNPGDLVLDPFCGCGTTVVAAEKLGRRWIGIDIAYEAMGIIRNRFGNEHVDLDDYEITGAPIDMDGAGALADHDAFAFEQWIIKSVGANPTKKTGDGGYDGDLRWSCEGKRGRTIIEVKSGKNTQVAWVRSLRGVMESQGADQAILVVLGTPTRGMKTEAASAGYFEEGGREYSRIAIYTVAQMLNLTPIPYPGRKRVEDPKRNYSLRIFGSDSKNNIV